MNKTFITVGIIFTVLATLMLLIFGGVFMNASDIVYELALQDPDIQLVAEELVSLFSTVAVFMFIFAFLNIVAAVRIFMLRNSQTASKEALGWAIYLLFGAGLLGGIFSILGVQVKNPTPVAASSGSTLESQLKELDKLFEKGLISQDEYNERRERIISRV